jgi:Ser/Thr protein kinase RdoA (MazF antagonist)
MVQLELDVLHGMARSALNEWDLDVAEIELETVSENTVFRVVTADAENYVLRVHRPGYHTFEELKSEHMWTKALNATGISAPVPKHARDGRDYVEVPVPGSNDSRYVGIAHWIEGIPLASILENEKDETVIIDYFRQLGNFAATIHDQSSAWTIPPDFTRHALDADGLMGDTPFWGPFWESPELTVAERELVITARDNIHEILSDLGKDRESYGMIHADLHPRNVLMNGDSVSIIDFDDAGFGFHLYELAVALFYDQSLPWFPPARDALLKGYRSRRPLDQTAEELLPVFLLARALAALGWLQDRPEHKTEERVRNLIKMACNQADQLFNT